MAGARTFGKLAHVRQHQRIEVERHHAETDSPVAKALLEDWPAALARFTEVMPADYKRVLEAKAEALEEGLSEDEAAARIMEVLHG